jgi:uncharacterized lipoprotein YmbA
MILKARWMACAPACAPACALAVAVAVAVALAAGCSSSPPRRMYLLDTPLQTDVSAPQTQNAPATQVVQIQNVLLPDYLDTEDILTRDSAHELQSSASGRWGERLSAGVTHALGAELASRLPDYRVEPPRPTDRLAPQILVDVDAFDVWRDGRCMLSASWTIVQPGDRPGAAPPVSGREVFVTAPGPASAAGDPTVVAAMAATVKKLADALVQDITTPASVRISVAH